jgi:hypothetical protein
MTMRLTEPLCFFVVYPLLPSLVKDFGVAKTEEQVGYCAPPSQVRQAQLSSEQTPASSRASLPSPSSPPSSNGAAYRIA